MKVLQKLAITQSMADIEVTAILQERLRGAKEGLGHGCSEGCKAQQTAGE
jgi:hypothetical protein